MTSKIDELLGEIDREWNNGDDLIDKTPHLIKALKAACEGLEKYKQLEIHYKSSGGLFNPELMSFNMETIHESVFNPAQDALKQIEEILEGKE